MTKQKESLGLSIATKQINFSSTMFLKSVPEGIKYFNTWDAGLTSLDSMGGQRFEKKFSNNTLGHKYSCNSIKIIDDIAVVAYGNYTDLNKVVYENDNGGMYQPWAVTYGEGSGGTGVPPAPGVPEFIEGSLDEEVIYVDVLDEEVIGDTETLPDPDTQIINLFSNDFVLPLLFNDFEEMLGVSGDPNIELDLSNLFILIEHDGYYTDDTGAVISRDIDKGRYELLRYNSNPDKLNDSGYFYFHPNFKHVVVNSKYSVDDFSTELYLGTNSRLTTTQVTKDVEQLSRYMNYKWGFLGYKKISIIKYNPIIECGRADLYLRKSGKITQELSLGKVLSVDHALKNGDIIKISGARNAYGKNATLNGIKYVQVNTNDIFSLYDDQDMTIKSFTVDGIDPDASWICVGNVYSQELPDGWEYQKTIYSPTGRNGYTIQTSPTESLVTYGLETNEPLSSVFSEDTDYYEVLKKDIGYSLTLNEAVLILDETISMDPIDSIIPVRSYQSSLDFLWTNTSHYLNGCKFGCDIDFKVFNGEYHLAIGESGLEHHYAIKFQLSLLSVLPPNIPQGKVHLFTITIDANKKILYNYEDTIYAQTGSSNISQPDSMVLFNDYKQVKFYVDTAGSALSQTMNVSGQQNFLTQSLITDKFLTDDYWFGAYLYHFDIYEQYSGEFKNGSNPYTSVYFSNFCPPNLAFYNDGTNNILNNSAIYPYCDSFGKSVCLGSVNGNLFLATSSINKVTVLSPATVSGYSNREYISLIPTPYPTMYSGTDCGYFHIFNITGTPTITSRFFESGVSTISGGIDVQYLKAKKYAQTIKFDSGKFYIGIPQCTEFYNVSFPRPNEPTIDGEIVTSNAILDFSSFSGVTIFTKERSRIESYSHSSGTFSLSETIYNVNADDNYYVLNMVDVVGEYGPNQKELIIQNKKYTNDRTFGYMGGYYNNCIFLPSDRFGEFFDVKGDLLVTPSYDITNEFGVEHMDLSGAELQCGYLHVYEKTDSPWRFMTKFSASIDSVDDRYMYSELADGGSNCVGALRSLGNYHFGNNYTSSRTWDIDLNNSFVIIDDRVLLKDPFGYSIFKKGPYAEPTEISISTLEETVSPYFKFDEHFNANYNRGDFNELCNFAHTKYGFLYEYNDPSYIINRFDPAGLDIQLNTPIYFFSLPVTSGSFTNKKVTISVEVVIYSGSQEDLVIKIYRKDPRTNSVAEYPSLYSYSCPQDSTYLTYSNTNPAGEDIFTKMCLSSDDSSIVYPVSIVDGATDDSKIYTFEIDESLVQQYILANSQIKTSTIISNGQSLSLEDSTKTTYNSGVSVGNTLVVGFCFGNVSYSCPQINTNKIFEITLLTAATEYSTSTRYSQQKYDCIYNKVVSYAYNTILNNCTGERLYTNPVLGFGTSNTNATNSYRNLNDDGSGVGSFQLLSIDNYNSFDAYNKIIGNDLNVVTSFDIQPLNYLPLIMCKTDTSEDNITLFLRQGNYVSGTEDMFIEASDALSTTTTLFLGPSNYTNNITLLLRVSLFPIDPEPDLSGTSVSAVNLSIPVVQRLTGEELGEVTTLYMQTVDLGAGINLTIEGPRTQDNNSNLFILPHKPISTYSDNSPSLYTYGNYKAMSDIGLVTAGNRPGLTSLTISGPLTFDSSVNLLMSSYSQDINSNTTLVIYEKPLDITTLYISAPTVTDSSFNLFTKYTPTSVNSIDDASRNSCGMYANDIPFDVTTGAEELVDNTNSIASRKYSTGTIFGYSPNTLSLNSITNDLDFYKSGRFQKLTHSNGEILAVGTIEDTYPKLLLYSLNNSQAELIIKIEDCFNLISLPSVSQSSTFLDVKVADNGYTAISFYNKVIAFGRANAIGYFTICIYDTEGNLVSRWNRSFTDSPEGRGYADNNMGMTLAWNSSNDLLYTKEGPLFGTIQKRSYPSYDSDETVIDFGNEYFYVPYKDEIYNNWATNKVPFYRMALGHRMKCVGNDIFLTAPLMCYKSMFPMASAGNVNFNGGFYKAIPTMDGYIVDYDRYENVSTSGNAYYGYEMAIGDEFSYATEASSNTIFTYDTATLSVQSTNGGGGNFGYSIEICKNTAYTVFGPFVYNINSAEYFLYGNLSSEIDPYIPPGNVILSRSSVIESSVITGGLHFVLRNFNAVYGFNTPLNIKKISILKQDNRFSTPTLFIQNDGKSAQIPLNLRTVVLTEGVIDLKVTGALNDIGLASLFIDHVPDYTAKLAGPLTLKAPDPISASSDVNSFIYGSTTTGTFFLSDDLSLYLAGSDIILENTAYLFIQAPLSGTSEAVAPLSIGYSTQPSSGSSSSILGINILNTQSSETNWMMASSKPTLFLNSSYGTSGSMPLWLYRIGVGGGQEAEGNTSMTIENKNKSSSVNLYTDSTYGISTNTTLVFTPSSGLKSGITKIQIFGYEE